MPTSVINVVPGRPVANQPTTLDGSQSLPSTLPDTAFKWNVIPWVDIVSPGGDYLLISSDELMALPTNTAAYTRLKSFADSALSITVTGSPTVTSPWLTSYQDGGTGRTTGRFVAAALVAARTGSASHRAQVEAGLRYVIGTETMASTDGTGASDAFLSTARQLPGWLIAADLIKFNTALTGTRTGWTGTSFATWAATLFTKSIGTHSRWKTINGTSDDSANNWGACATNSRSWLAAFLKNTTQMNNAAARVARWLGDRTKSTEFNHSSDYDPSYAYNPTSFRAINNASMASSATDRNFKDGLLVEDAGRTAGAYNPSASPFLDNTGFQYVSEGLFPMLGACIALDRQGFPTFEWSSDDASTAPTMKRVADWANRRGVIANWTSTTNNQISWIMNHFYPGNNYPKPTTTGLGRWLVGADWLYG